MSNIQIRRYAGFFYHVNSIHGVLCQWVVWRCGYIGAPKFIAIYMRYINENKNPRSAGDFTMGKAPIVLKRFEHRYLPIPSLVFADRLYRYN